MSQTFPQGVMNMGKIQRIHFVGIGGAGMSGIAELLHNIGYQVSGSDISESKLTQYLSAKGITIYIGHHEEQIHEVDVVVRSTAIADDNVEILYAQRIRIPVIPRAEMLAELMRFRYGIAVAGTHGKTTTTSLITSILAQAKKDPTFVIGGKLNSAGTNARLGSGPYLVAEADESDASFLHLQPMISVITNLEEDHMDTYQRDINRLKETFVAFIHRLPFYGVSVICADDENLFQLSQQFGRRIISYGIDKEQVDYRAVNIRQEQQQTFFSVQYWDDKLANKAEFEVCLNMPGRHNVLNALAAIAIAKELVIENQDIQQALTEFEGIGRRFQYYGNRTIEKAERFILIDDYAHHPSELKATISAVREGWKGSRLVVVFQPHRYTRTRDLYDDFIPVLSEADVLILLPVYAAGEKPIAGAESRDLCWSIRSVSSLDPILVQNEEHLRQVLPQLLHSEDILLAMGAGSIGAMIANLASETESL